MGERLASCSMTNSSVLSAGHIARHIGSSQKAEALLRPMAGPSDTVQGWMSHFLVEVGWYGIVDTGRLGEDGGRALMMLVNGV